MAAQQLRRRTPETQRRTTASSFTLLRGGKRLGARTQAIVRTQPLYRRIGKVQRASSPLYNFTVRTIREIRTGGKQVLIGRTHRTGPNAGKTDWRMMSIIEYKERFMKKDARGKEAKLHVLTTSASMLAKHPDAFLHVGHELAKSAVQLLAMVA